ncbi:hypothetical protein LPU83_pLPU83d_0654 (plasmid) [Rhizobium favelukesii]|uniref:Uncharacterized protein n=1 Tax=Rhizobium favelukesii TaxID=348824 RepID=W6RPD7_9HYPH|nr:hypothetical protein LPU83_pLPU83d_0654 [Rhizobium favelukesii]
MGIEWCPSKERASHSGVDAGVAGARVTKAAQISGSKEVTIDAVACRKTLVGATTHTFAGSARLAGRTGRCGDDESAALLHDVSRYGGGSVKPSKVSMVIICP